MSQKLYNPKSNSPAIFIPSWLSQVPIKIISLGAKMLYGRLSQWSNDKGQVHRSASNLGKEIGISTRQCERLLKELRDIGLIDTHRIELGGVNYFIFYIHPLMAVPIIKELCYENDINPPTNMAAPPAKSVGTPPTNMAERNKNKYKNNKTQCDFDFLGIIDLWNELALKKGLSPVNKENMEEMRKVKRSIYNIGNLWPELNKDDAYNLINDIELNAHYFNIYLTQCVESGWYLLCGGEPHSIDVILKETNFKKSIIKIKNKLTTNN